MKNAEIFIRIIIFKYYNSNKYFCVFHIRILKKFFKYFQKGVDILTDI